MWSLRSRGLCSEWNPPAKTSTLYMVHTLRSQTCIQCLIWMLEKWHSTPYLSSLTSGVYWYMGHENSLPYWHDLTFMVLQLINLNSWSLVFLSINSFFKPRSFKENCDKFHFLLLLRINMLRRLKYFCNFQENRNAERLFFKLLKEVAGMLNPVKE